MSRHWVDFIEKDELVAKAPHFVLLDMSKDSAIEDAASYLYKGGPFLPDLMPSSDREQLLGLITDDRPEKEVWEQIKKEIYLLVCTDDDKYKKLRLRLRATTKKPKMGITGMVAAYIAGKIGVEAGVVVGFCAVALYGVVKLTKEVYCGRASKKYS